MDTEPGNVGLHVPSFLHELLLALVGHTGDVFLDEGDSNDIRNPQHVTFSVANVVPFAEPSDREVLNNFLKLGFHCRSIDNYIKMQSAQVPSISSAYRKAVARGLSEVLDVYKAAILKLQRYLLQDSNPALSALHHYLFEFQVLLPPLHWLVYEVHHRNLFGGQLLHLLYTKAQCGIPSVRSCCQRLLWHCNQVLYHQLAAWLVHGQLMDLHNELFVQKTGATDEVAANTQFEGEGVDLHNLHSIEWQSGFEVVSENIPPYISAATADDILFIGRAVRVLRHPVDGGKGEDRGLLPAADALEFADSLRKLQRSDTFQQLEFEGLVHWMRGKVAGYLWKLAVVLADLPRHLAALRDYFLMAKGDFWQCFLLESRSLMSLPPKPATATSDINLPFIQSAAKSSADHDPKFNNIRLVFKDSHLALSYSSDGRPSIPALPRAGGSVTARLDGQPLYIPAFDKWDELALEYQLEWPLHLFLNPEVVSKYSVIFQYLLRLKRLHLSLEGAWGAMRRFTAASEPQRKRVLKLWALRHHMAHIMSNLQIYVQLDVIEAQYVMLQHKIETARDFSEAEEAHRRFIDALVLQSFLDKKQVMALLEALMSLCNRLCTLVQQQEGPGGEFCDESTEKKLDSISADFWRRAKMLYLHLQSNKLQGTDRAPFLRQFLLRLNYNGYMEKEVHKQIKPIEVGNLAR